MKFQLLRYTLFSLLVIAIAGCSGDEPKASKEERHEKGSGALEVKLSKQAQKETGIKVEEIQPVKAKRFS